jgi:hypothetical protein
MSECADHLVGNRQACSNHFVQQLPLEYSTIQSVESRNWRSKVVLHIDGIGIYSIYAAKRGVIHSLAKITDAA